MAEVDTSIYGNIKSPVEIMGDYAQTVNAMNQNKLFQQTFDARQAIGQAYQKSINPLTGQVDPTQVTRAIANDPRASFMAGEVAAQALEQQQAREAVTSAQMQNKSRAAGIASSYLFPLVRDPKSADRKNVMGALSEIYVDPNIPADYKQFVLEAFKGVANADDEQLPNYVSNLFAHLQSMAGEQGNVTPNVQGVNTGQGTQFMDVNPLSNQGAIGSTVKHKLSPSEKASRVGTMVDTAEGKTPGTVPLGTLVDDYGNPLSGERKLGDSEKSGISIDVPTVTEDQLAEPGNKAPAKAPSGPEGFVPSGAPLGTEEFTSGMGKAAADRATETINLAREAPTRINILDNILKQSKAGVNTGPTQEFQTNVLGVVANLPILSKAMGAAKDDVAKFQVLNKFIKQNAIRSWQAAGGTGTDEQLDAIDVSTPGAKNFPKALQELSQFAKAGEMALLAKANAQEKYMDGNDSPSRQKQFEAKWRDNFDPLAFQLRATTDKAEADELLKGMKPDDKQKLLVKYRALRDMGAF